MAPLARAAASILAGSKAPRASTRKLGCGWSPLEAHKTSLTSFRGSKPVWSISACKRVEFSCTCESTNCPNGETRLESTCTPEATWASGGTNASRPASTAANDAELVIRAKARRKPETRMNLVPLFTLREKAGESSRRRHKSSGMPPSGQAPDQKHREVVGKRPLAGPFAQIVNQFGDNIARGSSLPFEQKLCQSLLAVLLHAVGCTDFRHAVAKDRQRIPHLEFRVISLVVRIAGDAQYPAAAKQTGGSSVCPDHKWLVMARVGVADSSGRWIDDRIEKCDEFAGRAVGAERPVERGQCRRRFGPCFGKQMNPGVQTHHQERGGQPFARDIAHQYREPAVR